MLIPAVANRCVPTSALALLFVATLCFCTTASAGADGETIEHDLSITIAPQKRTLQVEDRIRPSSVQREEGRMTLLLNRGLTVQALHGAVLEGPPEEVDALRRYRIRLEPSAAEVVLSYAGIPEQPAASSLRLEPGTVNLDAGSGWYPLASPPGLLRYRLQARLPASWHLIASAMPAAGAMSPPLPGIQLVAAPFHMHRDGTVPAVSVALRSADEVLAARYLSATRRHLLRYEALLGRYPYSQFGIVENIEPTGLGFPGFTLLGHRVMRLPFIPDTSLPHEIVHNWWGNGVFVDASQGNWSEGLTTYLADHLNKELAGEDTPYRRDALARYRHAHLAARTRPLTTFLARHDRSSQSLGYDRAMMVFHMMRRAVGDRDFVAGLRAFYAGGRFQRRTTGDLMRALVPDSEGWFAQWWERADAPQLSLQCCTVRVVGTHTQLSGRLRQLQAGPPFPLRVPLALSVAGEERARMHTVEMATRAQSFTFELPAGVLTLRVDPAFDLMRIPMLEELPPSVSEVLQARQRVAVLPVAVQGPLRLAYRSLAAAFQAQLLEPGVALPDGDSAVIAFHVPGPVAQAFGPELNRLAARAASHVSVARLAPDGDAGRLRPVMVLHLEQGSGLAAAARRMAAILPRYGHYGRLAFTTAPLRNVFKAHGTVRGAPLQWRARPGAQPLPLPPRALLTEAAVAP